MVPHVPPLPRDPLRIHCPVLALPPHEGGVEGPVPPVWGYRGPRRGGSDFPGKAGKVIPKRSPPSGGGDLGVGETTTTRRAATMKRYHPGPAYDPFSPTPHHQPLTSTPTLIQLPLKILPDLPPNILYDLSKYWLLLNIRHPDTIKCQ